MRQHLKPIILTALLLTFYAHSFAQSNFSNLPDSARFVTADIDNFWKAFDHYKKDTSVNIFGKEYIDIGSDGVKGFTPYRIRSADNLYKMVKKRQADYEKVRTNTLRIKEKEKQCRSTFYALKYLYPQAKFPPVYFVIGAYNSGGTSGDQGLFIGAEMQNNIDGLPGIVAHELIHFQQNLSGENPTLLQQSIIEGSADFIGELISGTRGDDAANNYGNAHADRLCKEFVSLMNGTERNDWLYGTSKKDDRPNDLGYWMGYQITAHYYAKATDKKQAIYDILNIKDYTAFLKKSGYLDKYLK
ncbi:Predicted Zn-dependent protease [Mucilaginibacter sp. OK268]|uniref:gliding motility protein GldB-related protein n=1 Tax=Mucilaginibacter sp. OK268 TaxID=1881048 RepID=UPI00088064A3|nr:DUF2268 domain-containing putative Zn-dependent protease [Mucilaginibacter sp. OK268]SDP53322.1 Predicted Zn-dependent protease [Mucilaginibacter sp. OK268]